MPEPIYSVKLFYGDMKFTNDYSNVLQFDTKAARDTYFDTLSDTILKENTETNRVMFNGGTIKLALDITDLPNLDKINYCYIEYGLVSSIDFVQYRKYYFIKSYNIISSYSDVTVVEFSLEYDVWQNNQFDFTIKESNIERMHVDRWENASFDIKYTRPVMDAIESFSKVDKKYQIESDTVITANHHGSTKDTNVVWVMVTALHTFSNKVDQMLYHFFPVIYKAEDLTFLYTNPKDEAYFTQNSIYVAPYAGNVSVYFPSIQALDSAFLDYACGNVHSTDSDTVQVINVQFFNWLPLKLEYVYDEHNVISDCLIKTLDNKTLERYVGTPYFPGIVGNGIFCSYAVGDLTQFGELYTALTKSYIYTGYSRPQKPANNALYSDSYEPALYMSPIRKRYIALGDTSAQAEIPDILYISEIYKKSRLEFNGRISFSSISAYCYFTIGDALIDNRVGNNIQGFAIIKPSYLGDITSEPWKSYVTTQRDSDRAMMWTNIATGGLAESGSTAISAGIGYRSNMERAKALENDATSITSGINGGSARMNLVTKDASDRLGNKAELLNANATMYRGMAGSAMMMSGIGGITAFSSNAVHQAMAQRSREKSIMNTPGTLAKSGNAIASIIDNQFKFYYIETKVDDVSYEKYKTLFMKYGYYIGTVELPNIKSRKFFNYIKTNGAILTGSCNQLILSYLASIFDNGVTIWHMDYTTYATIYDYTKENIERSLM